MPALVAALIAVSPLTGPQSASAQTPPDASELAQIRPPPTGFVDLRSTLPTACFHIGYHRPDNFTGAVLPGYGAPGAWMLAEPAAALAKVLQDVTKQGFTLVIYDAYRPYRGTLAMVAWAERTNQLALFEAGYIARRSGHNHGHTVDLGLADPATCQPVDAGTPWDTLSEASHTRNATGPALQNRLTLRDAMVARGYTPYSKEWWHFGYPLEGTRARDVPYGCHEPEEGAWVAPVGWNIPGNTYLSPVDTRACPSRP